jgi:hypothetical protein
MTEDALSDVIGRVLREAPFAMRQLAADSSLSYDVLRSWRSGRRRPSRMSAQRLAEGLERRGERLLLLARELRTATNGRTDAIVSSRGEPSLKPKPLTIPRELEQAASGRDDSETDEPVVPPHGRPEPSSSRS